jgi:hypothetical protein
MEEERRRNSNWSNTNSTSTGSPLNSSSCGMRSYYATLEDHINNKAKRLTIEYIREQGGDFTGGKDQQDQFFLVYKFIHTPIDMIIAGMNTMMREQATQYFRRLAKQLHPDKNHHPLAKEAFQKLSEAIQVVGSSSSSKVVV